MSATTRHAAAALLLGSLPVLAAAPALAEPVTLRFVQTGDIDRLEPRDGRGGFAKLAAVVKRERAKGATLFVHSGDTISPSLLSGIDKGFHTIDILNRMGVDIMVPGNHEFDFGPQVFRARMAQAKFPVLASNIRETDGSRPRDTLDDTIVEVEGLKIGFYGLTTEDTPTLATAPGLTFMSSIDTGRAKSKALRDAGADFVVAVAHTPLPIDTILVRDGSADLVLSGHDEHLLTFYDGKSALTESYSQADYVVVTTVSIDKTLRDGKTSVSWRPSFEIVDTAAVEADPDIAAVVKGYADTLDKELAVEIGSTSTPLDSRRATVRGGESAIGNLFADAMRGAVGADVAITNGGAIRADRTYPAGARLTRADIFAELPFNNLTVKLELTGEQIRQALENGFSQVREQAGRFPQVSGMVVEADGSRLPGERVVSVTIGGEPLSGGRTYTVATNEFMAAGGDGYRGLKGAKVLIDAAAAQLIASQVIDYVQAQGTIGPKVEGRIKLR